MTDHIRRTFVQPGDRCPLCKALCSANDLVVAEDFKENGRWVKRIVGTECASCHGKYDDTGVKFT